MVNFENHVDKEAMKKYAEEQIKIVAGKLAREIYDTSQSKCPVDSGKLKGSGSIVQTKKGYEVEYDCDYAAAVDSLPESMGGTHYLSGSFNEIIRGLSK